MIQPTSTGLDGATELFEPVIAIDGSTATSPEHEPSGPNNEPAVREDSLGSSVSWMLILTVVQKSLGFVRSIVVCRLLDPVNLGLMGLSVAFIETALPVCLLSIPAIFCRYIEKFRREARSRAFIRQATLLCGGLLAIGLGFILAIRSSVAEYVFGGTGQEYLVWMCVVALIPAAIFSFATEMLMAFKCSRTSSNGHFVRGTGLTVLSIILLCCYQANVTSFLIATILSFTIACAFILPRLKRAIQDLPADTADLPFFSTWRNLLGVVLCYWLVDFMTNMFFTIDRYMLLNLSPVSEQEALAYVGNYESAHVLPVLMGTVIMMIARIQLPYQSSRWESGEVSAVSDSTNLTIKLACVGVFLFAAALTMSGGFAFQVLFDGKYEAGLQALPVLCSFYCLGAITHIVLMYLWCAERATLATVAGAVGIVANIAINWLAVPYFGVQGVASATLAAGVVQLVVLMWIASHNQLRLHRSTLAICGLPFTLIFGWPTVLLGATVVAAATWKGILFHDQEWQKLLDGISKGIGKLKHRSFFQHR